MDTAQREVVDEPHELLQQQLKQAMDSIATLIKRLSQFSILFLYFIMCALLCNCNFIDYNCFFPP